MLISSKPSTSKTTSSKSSPYPRAYPSTCTRMSCRWAGSSWRRDSTSAPLPQEGLDGAVDRLLVGDLGEGHVAVGPQVVAQVLDELAGAVGALHLAVAEEVHRREQVGLEQVDAEAGVVGAPVVAVGEVEGVDVPLRAGVVGLDDLL